MYLQALNEYQALLLSAGKDNKYHLARKEHCMGNNSTTVHWLGLY